MRDLASAVAIVMLGSGLVPAAEAPVERREIRLASRPASDVRPFSDAVLVGNTLYLAGRTGGDKDGKIPTDPADEARAVMDQIKAVLAQEKMAMDDLVTVQVFCTDVKYYATFNDVYRTYFTKFPARAFIGSGPLLGGARFEVQGIAVKR
jgi:enamine deaminase RidA (YjgF/YER057c/UK114 family)